jgi:hypothetical protein
VREFRFVGALVIAIGLAAAGFALASRGSVSASAPPDASPQQINQDRPFRHAQHEAFACGRCHSSIQQHGRLLITSRQDCLSCHHAPEQKATCQDCHSADSLAAYTYALPQTFQMGERTARERTLPFMHVEHEGIACATCHTEPVTLSARATSCESCHQEHHAATLDCVRCHQEAPPADVHPRIAHVTCTGAGCHDAQPFLEQERTRTLCLSCHQELNDHKPDVNCVDCHVLPPWGSVAPPRRE